jgi:hypothetical protein
LGKAIPKQSDLWSFTALREFVMKYWVKLASCAVILLAYLVFKEVYVLGSSPWVKMGAGVTEMLAPFALIGLVVMLLNTSKQTPKAKPFKAENTKLPLD